MDERRATWKKAIRALLDSHGLSVRGAAIRAGRPSLRTYISDWLQGQIPQYNTAWDFLRHFSPQEAKVCLKAAGYPLPEELVSDLLKTERESIAAYLIEKEAWLQEKVKQMFEEIEKGAP